MEKKNTPNFTPGPWKSALTVQENGPNFYTIASSTFGGKFIAQVENEANALLIAAAPDLLEALRECSEALTSDAAISKRKELLERADKALAKAEGKE